MKVQDRSQSQAATESQPEADDGPEPAEVEPHVDSEPGDVEEELSLDIVFEILKNSRRREVIRHLRRQDDRVSLGELAEHIAAIENDTTVDALTSSQRKRVYVGLYQCHLPKMDDVGVVEFNQNRGHVELTDQVDVFEEYLDASNPGRHVKWYRYYGAISVLGAIGLIASILGSPPGWLLFGYLAGVVVVATCCSLLHWSAERDH